MRDLNLERQLLFAIIDMNQSVIDFSVPLQQYTLASCDVG